MKFAIITHVCHIKSNNQYYGYAPYIREMNIWLKDVDKVIVVAPLMQGNPTEIDIPYKNDKIDFYKVQDFDFVNVENSFRSVLKLPKIFWNIFWAMKKADHIHLRCPGNMGLLGCIAQIFFPSKKKTAKYAGNWDQKSKQPATYCLQKWILSNTFLTRNMQVLVYGEWENQSKNIKSFFTATYSDSEKEIVIKNNIESDSVFIFVGSLVSGKNPIYAVKLVEQLVKNNKKVLLNIFGEGIERVNLENYIKSNQLENFVFLHGNQSKETLKQFYKKSHFVILPSKSEGWPKAIAEGMFWRCVPLATNVSCVPFMIDYGKRGILLEMNVKKDLAQVKEIILDQNKFEEMSKLASVWSQNYTIDEFEIEIEKLLLK
ncbi:glycosyltransferase involved in cell wall biosynthesis [Flavobacterium cutihirudinis]|uniref:Glycosyltransferase involved in cell wall biosynthesis n=1 Tax=Flavobacterium cutihirudinis TaxID=1265740 RepID=A0A3D9FK51_9FLAO|nr:glycosyltransferase [Flavobacterium cutihirudinis]RED19560.1 glycosyltransferase involved in cell wall biosynthesis [Flavobacterium cutihirudinis]